MVLQGEVILYRQYKELCREQEEEKQGFCLWLMHTVRHACPWVQQCLSGDQRVYSVGVIGEMSSGQLIQSQCGEHGSSEIVALSRWGEKDEGGSPR